MFHISSISEKTTLIINALDGKIYQCYRNLAGDISHIEKENGIIMDADVKNGK